MSRRLTAVPRHGSFALFALFALLSAAWLGGCISRFEQPTLGEPHAVAKIRIVYHSVPNGSLDERVLLNERSIEVAPHGERGSLEVALTHAVRIRPEPASWSIRSTFSHQKSRLEDARQRVSDQYPCGTATNGAQSSTVVCTGYRPESYEETLQRTVVDASCDAILEHHTRAGAEYLLQFDFYEHGRCTLQCYELTRLDKGGFDRSPCL